MGLGYEQLRPANEGLIYCSITGFGPDGPHSKRYSALPYKSVNLSPALINWCHHVTRGGYDVIAASMGGLMHVTGAEGGEPAKVRICSLLFVNYDRKRYTIIYFCMYFKF